MKAAFRGAARDLVEQLGVTDIFIATDPDREGEAIGWHLAEAFRDLLRQDLGNTRLHEAPDQPCVATLSSKHGLDSEEHCREVPLHDTLPLTAGARALVRWILGASGEARARLAPRSAARAGRRGPLREPRPQTPAGLLRARPRPDRQVRNHAETR